MSKNTMSSAKHKLVIRELRHFGWKPIFPSSAKLVTNCDRISMENTKIQAESESPCRIPFLPWLKPAREPLIDMENQGVVRQTIYPLCEMLLQID